jgi:nicotinate-nucleotide adenylyltransferase
LSIERRLMADHVIVFGGTFDPVHVGHLSTAEQVQRRTGADAVWFVPAAIPPQRPPAVAPAEARLAMLRAAVAGRSGLRVLDDEVRRGSVSHTAGTMDSLHRAHPDEKLSVLLGADAARTITAWPRAADLLGRERFIIMNRSGVKPFDANELQRLGYEPSRTALIEVDSPPVSASDVRRRVAAGESLEGLVPPAVAALIDELGLYHSSGRRVHNAGG